MAHLSSHLGQAGAIFTLALLFALSLPPLPSASSELVQISSDPYHNNIPLYFSNHQTEVEPDTFAFGKTIVATFQVGRFVGGGASNIGWATSRDAGKSWAHGFLPGITVFAGGSYAAASDSSVAYDARHKVWIISYLALKMAGAPPHFVHIDVLASRSSDGGLTWEKPVPVRVTPNGFLDKSWSVCDDMVSSPFFGNCYAEWDGAGKTSLIQMSTSTDGGLRWGAPKATADHASGVGGQPVVQPDGTVIVPILIALGRQGLIVGSFRSTNGGASWSKTLEISSLTTYFEQANVRNPNLPSAQIDRDGRVYVVWQDCRFEPGCSANDIVMSTSPNGLTWTDVQRLPIDPVGSGIDHFTPGLGVDRTTGGDEAHLGLTYYYFTNASCTTTTCQLYVGFVSSIDGGEDWSRSQRLAGPMMLTWFPLSGGYMYGDYISTSIVPAADGATAVFAVAQAPTGGSSCNDDDCREAMYTTSKDALLIKGGTLAALADHAFSFGQQAVWLKKVGEA